MSQSDSGFVFACIYLDLGTFVTDFREFGLQFGFSDNSVKFGLDFNTTTKVYSEVGSLMDSEENQADNDEHR